MFSFKNKQINDRIASFQILSPHRMTVFLRQLLRRPPEADHMCRRCDRTLLGYEEKLGLIAKFQKTKEKVTEIHRLTEEFSRTQNQALIEAIGRISNEILDL